MQWLWENHCPKSSKKLAEHTDQHTVHQSGHAGSEGAVPQSAVHGKFDTLPVAVQNKMLHCYCSCEHIVIVIPDKLILDKHYKQIMVAGHSYHCDWCCVCAEKFNFVQISAEWGQYNSLPHCRAVKVDQEPLVWVEVKRICKLGENGQKNKQYMKTFVAW